MTPSGPVVRAVRPLLVRQVPPVRAELLAKLVLPVRAELLAKVAKVALLVPQA